MLPWMRNKQMKSAGIMTAIRKPEGGMTPETPEESESYGIKHAAKELIEALATGDEDRVANALKAAFKSFEKEPHEEAPHPED